MIMINFKNSLKMKNFMSLQKYLKLYGTSKDTVDSTIKTNDILFDIDWQGTKQLNKFKNLKLIKIFLITSKKSDLKKD